jgi:rod shape-determining protein MreD
MILRSGMREGPLQRAQRTLRGIVPFVLTLMLSLAPTMPFRMPRDISVVPDLSLMAVFYWTIYRPDLLPMPAVFAIGLIQDIVTGGPIGVTPLILVGAYGMLLNQRRVFLGKPFMQTWWGFLIVATAACVVKFLVACLQASAFVPVQQAGLQYFSTLLLFPLIVWLLVAAHRQFLPEGSGQVFP